MGLTRFQRVIPTFTAELAIQIEEADNGITYIGKAPVGSLSSEAVWQVSKVDESGNPEFILKWADGNREFDNIWDNRASLNYL